jgi:hypothetical protein
MSFSTGKLTSPTVSWAVLQQLLVCFGVLVQFSLRALKIRHYVMPLAFLPTVI